MLAARCREVGATAFDPGVAAQRYAGLAWPLLHGILAELAVAEGYSRLDPALSHLRHAGSVRLASWVAEAALSLARDGSGRGGSSGAAANTSLEAVGVLRRRAQATVLRHLPSLWSLLLTWRPQATPLLEDSGVQQPLWTVAAAFLELGSGAEQASPSDAVLAETLARSLAEPGPGLDSTALGELRGAVVAGFCARALARVSIRHVSNERVAVVALRLVQVTWVRVQGWFDCGVCDLAREWCRPHADVRVWGPQPFAAGSGGLWVVCGWSGPCVSRHRATAPFTRLAPLSHSLSALTS